MLTGERTGEVKKGETPFGEKVWERPQASRLRAPSLGAFRHRLALVGLDDPHVQLQEELTGLLWKRDGVAGGASL